MNNLSHFSIAQPFTAGNAKSKVREGRFTVLFNGFSQMIVRLKPNPSPVNRASSVDAIFPSRKRAGLRKGGQTAKSFSRVVISAFIVAVFFGGIAQAQVRTLEISVVDLQDKPIEFVQLTTTAKSTTEVTNSDSKATIKLENVPINSEVGLRIVGAPKDKDYVFISPWDKRVMVPSKVTIVLAERGIRQLLEDTRALKALASNIIRDEAPGEFPELRREAAMAEVARQFGLPKGEIIRAIQTWGEKAKDSFDKAQADFIAKNYAKASAGFAEARRLRKAVREKAISEEFNACFAHGRSLFEEGKYRESAEAYQEALEFRKDDAVTMNNLALSLEKSGKYAEAEPLYKSDLAIKEKALGADHHEVAVTLNNLAGLYEAQGKYVEAEPLYKRSLAITEKALGANHPSVAVTLNNLANFFREQEKYVEAEPLYKRSLAITEKALGADHPSVAVMLNNFANLYRTQGKYVEAEPLYKRDLTITEKTLGADHPSVAVTLNNLAGLYRAQGEYVEAEPLYKRSLAITEKALGANHPSVAVTLNNLAELYRAQEKYVEAEPLYKRSLAIKEEALGADHPSVAVTLNNLALLKSSQEKYSEAELFLKRALMIFEKARGGEHADLATMLEGYAYLLRKLNRVEEAAKLEDRAAKIKAKHK